MSRSLKDFTWKDALITVIVLILIITIIGIVVSFATGSDRTISGLQLYTADGKLLCEWSGELRTTQPLSLIMFVRERNRNNRIELIIETKPTTEVK